MHDAKFRTLASLVLVSDEAPLCWLAYGTELLHLSTIVVGQYKAGGGIGCFLTISVVRLCAQAAYW